MISGKLSNIQVKVYLFCIQILRKWLLGLPQSSKLLHFCNWQNSCIGCRVIHDSVPQISCKKDIKLASSGTSCQFLTTMQRSIMASMIFLVFIKTAQVSYPLPQKELILWFSFDLGEQFCSNWTKKSIIRIYSNL